MDKSILLAPRPATVIGISRGDTDAGGAVHELVGAGAGRTVGIAGIAGMMGDGGGIGRVQQSECVRWVFISRYEACRSAAR